MVVTRDLVPVPWQLSGLPVLVSERDNLVLFRSPGTFRLYGTSKRGVVGKSVRALLSAGTRTATLRFLSGGSG